MFRKSAGNGFQSSIGLRSYTRSKIKTGAGSSLWAACLPVDLLRSYAAEELMAQAKLKEK